jgi:hypothetical protein
VGIIPCHEKASVTAQWLAARWCNTDGIARQCSMSRAMKPLEAAIGQLLAPYSPAATGVTMYRTMMIQCTTFADYCNGRDGVTVQYRAHRSME